MLDICSFTRFYSTSIDLTFSKLSSPKSKVVDIKRILLFPARTVVLSWMHPCLRCVPEVIDMNQIDPNYRHVMGHKTEGKI